MKQSSMTRAGFVKTAGVGVAGLGMAAAGLGGVARAQTPGGCSVATATITCADGSNISAGQYVLVRNYFGTQYKLTFADDPWAGYNYWSVDYSTYSLSCNLRFKDSMGNPLPANTIANSIYHMLSNSSNMIIELGSGVSDNVVSLSQIYAGSPGNQPSESTITDPGFSVANFTGGSGPYVCNLPYQPENIVETGPDSCEVYPSGDSTTFLPDPFFVSFNPGLSFLRDRHNLMFAFFNYPNVKLMSHKRNDPYTQTPFNCMSREVSQWGTYYFPGGVYTSRNSFGFNADAFQNQTISGELDSAGNPLVNLTSISLYVGSGYSIKPIESVTISSLRFTSSQQTLYAANSIVYQNNIFDASTFGVQTYVPNGTARVIGNQFNNSLVSVGSFTGTATFSDNVFRGTNNYGMMFIAESQPLPGEMPGKLIFTRNDLRQVNHPYTIVYLYSLDGAEFSNNAYGFGGVAGVMCGYGVTNSSFKNENFFGNYPGWQNGGPGCLYLGSGGPGLECKGNTVTALKEGQTMQGMTICSQVFDDTDSNFSDGYNGLNFLPGVGKCSKIPPEILAMLEQKKQELDAKAAEDLKLLQRPKLPFES